MTWAVIAWEDDTVPSVELFENEQEAASRALVFAQYVPTAMVIAKEKTQ